MAKCKDILTLPFALTIYTWIGIMSLNSCGTYVYQMLNFIRNFYMYLRKSSLQESGIFQYTCSPDWLTPLESGSQKEDGLIASSLGGSRFHPVLLYNLGNLACRLSKKHSPGKKIRRHFIEF
jgi:hypothetical protein